MKNYLHILVLVLFVMSNGCITLHKPNGKKERIGNLKGDLSKTTKPEDLQAYTRPFNMEDVGKEQTKFNLQYITTEQIHEIASKNEHTLVVVYYPCGVILDFIKEAIKLGKKAQDTAPDKFKIIAVSSIYDFDFAKALLDNQKYSKTSYLMPAEQYGNRSLSKRLKFNKLLAPGIYQSHKDDIAWFYMFLFDKDKNIVFGGQSIFDPVKQESKIKDFDKLKKILEDTYINK